MVTTLLLARYVETFESSWVSILMCMANHQKADFNLEKIERSSTYYYRLFTEARTQKAFPFAAFAQILCSLDISLPMVAEL